MVLIRMGVVTALVKAGKPKTAKELSELSGGDELLIGKSQFISRCRKYWSDFHHLD